MTRVHLLHFCLGLPVDFPPKKCSVNVWSLFVVSKCTRSFGNSAPTKSLYCCHWIPNSQCFLGSLPSTSTTKATMQCWGVAWDPPPVWQGSQIKPEEKPFFFFFEKWFAFTIRKMRPFWKGLWVLFYGSLQLEIRFGIRSSQDVCRLKQYEKNGPSRWVTSGFPVKVSQGLVIVSPLLVGITYPWEGIQMVIKHGITSLCIRIWSIWCRWVEMVWMIFQGRELLADCSPLDSCKGTLFRWWGVHKSLSSGLNGSWFLPLRCKYNGASAIGLEMENQSKEIGILYAYQRPSHKRFQVSQDMSKIVNSSSHG